MLRAAYLLVPNPMQTSISTEPAHLQAAQTLPSRRRRNRLVLPRSAERVSVLHLQLSLQNYNCNFIRRCHSIFFLNSPTF
jgi:hypothetical protein